MVSSTTHTHTHTTNYNKRTLNENEQFKSHRQIKIRSETINNNAKYLILNTQADVFKKQFSDAVAAAISKIGCHVPSLVSICCCILFNPAYSP